MVPAPKRAAFIGPRTPSRLARSRCEWAFDAARHASVAGAEFGVFAPVFDPGSKPGSGRGIEALRELVGAVNLPMLALGGVSVAQVAACLQAGAAGVAVVSAVFGADDPAAAVREIADMLA
jgi:thiamine monophosphate synthase